MPMPNSDEIVADPGRSRRKEIKREAGAPSIPKRFDAHVAPSAPTGSPALSVEAMTEFGGNASPRMPLNASSGSSSTSLAAADGRTVRT